MSLAVRLILGYAGHIDFGNFDGNNIDELLPEFEAISLMLPVTVGIVGSRAQREQYPGFRNFIEYRNTMSGRQQIIDRRSERKNGTDKAQFNDRDEHHNIERDRLNADLRESSRLIPTYSQNALETLRRLEDPIISQLNQTRSD